MRLAYHDLVPGGSGAAGEADGVPPAVVLHREAAAGTDAAVAVARAAGASGRVVVPQGPYAFYPSGMEIGGVCWYRVLPGYDGTDPVSLATAVVQVGDLLDDLGLERALVVGFGQGAVVAVGAGLLRPGRVGWVVGVDPWPGHLPLLPPGAGAAAGAAAAPPVLLAASTAAGAGAVEQGIAALAGRGVAATVWCPEAEPGGASDAAAGAERGAAPGGDAGAGPLADALGRWWASVGGP